MDKVEKRIALSEKLGWERSDEILGCFRNKATGETIASLPEYFSDRDVVLNVVKNLPLQMQFSFTIEVWWLVEPHARKSRGFPGGWAVLTGILTADANLLGEALGITFRLWEYKEATSKEDEPLPS